MPGTNRREIRIHEPTEKQKLFLSASTRYVGYGGARGGGKSDVVQQKAVRLALRWPGIRLLIIRLTAQDAYENHVARLIDIFGRMAKWNR